MSGQDDAPVAREDEAEDAEELPILRWIDAEDAEAVEVGDEIATLQLLRRLRRDCFRMAEFRSLLAQDLSAHDVHRMDDDEVLRRLGWRLRKGRLVFAKPRVRRSILPSKPTPKPPPPPKPVPPKKKDPKRPWSLKVTVRTDEAFVWPKGPVTVELKGPSGGTKTTQMESNTSLPVFFRGDHDPLHEYETLATANGWKSGSSMKVLLKNEDDKEAEVLLEPAPGHVYLELKYKDPEGALRVLPKDLPVVVEFADGSTKKLKLGEKGLLDFEIEPLRKSQQKPLEWFTLRFEPEASCYVVNDPAKPDDPDVLKAKGDAENDAKDGAKRVFTLPKKFALKETDWALAPDDHFAEKHKFQDAKDPAVVFGTKESPRKLTLDPHWQHFRLVYAQRWRPREAARVSAPRLMVDAFLDKDAAGGEPDVRSNWTTGAAADGKDACQCVPWILRDDAKPKPDAKILYRVETKADTFVETKDDGKRVVADGVKHDKAEAERLRFYDLPKLWKSSNWFVRHADGDGRFKDVAARATTVAKPLVFCLDDIVLTDENLEPIAWVPNDRCAVFSHLFDDTDPEAGKLADLGITGVWKPDAAGSKSYFTKKPTAVETDRNYIADYPDWTRLVTAKGNLFDVFDKRVAEKDANSVVGARAGVRWVDATAPFPGIKMWQINGAGTAWEAAADDKPKPKRMLGGATPVEKRPGRTDKPFFSIQPFFEQRYMVRYSEPYDAAKDSGIGRFDMALLRCCDVDAGKETAVNLHYCRQSFVFNSAPPIGEDPFTDQLLANVDARWNGKDAVNTSGPALLVPQDNAVKLAVKVVWFGQRLPEAESHFSVDVVAPGGRDNRGGQRGTGESSSDNHVETNQFFASAHEAGHADSLPDEYNERWNGASYGQLSLKSNLPADVFEPDGRNVGGNDADPPMMNVCYVIRNRYFWHSAEWVRQATSNTKYKVKYDTYADFLVPPHEKTNRSYVYWPLEAKLSHQPAVVAPLAANRGKCDLYVFPLGRERFTDVVLPGKESAGAGTAYDGVLHVVVNVHCRLTGFDAPDADSGRSSALAALSKGAAMLNHKFVATGKVRQGSDQAWEFKRCLLHFSVRYLVTNHADNGLVTNIKNAMTRHFTVRAASTADPQRAAWHAAPGVPDLRTSAQWLKDSESLGTARTATLLALDALVAEYETIAKRDLSARIDKLGRIVSKGRLYVAETKAKWRIANPVAYARIKAVNAIVEEARLLSEHLTAVQGSDELRIVCNNAADVLGQLTNAMGEEFPSMVGVYKTANMVTAADLKPLVQAVITTNGDVKLA